MNIRCTLLLLKKRLRRIPPWRRICMCLISLFLLISVLGGFIYVKAIPVALLTLETVSKGVIEQKVVESAEKAIGECEADLVIRTTDSNGDIVSLEMDSAAVNRLIAGVVDNVRSDVERKGSIKVKVPLGSIFENRMLHGIGPSVSVRATPYIAAFARIDSSFYDAGINQTLHRVILTVTTDVTVVCAEKTVSFSTESIITVSEEIIVGRVPEGIIR